MGLWWVVVPVAVGLVSLVSGLVWLMLTPRPVSIKLKARHVLITGGSSGIGLCIAQLAAVEGSRVSLVGRDLEKLKSARQSVVEFYDKNTKRSVPKNAGFDGPRVQIFSADVKSYGSIESAVNAAVAEFGSLDVLVCSHGLSLPHTFEDTSLEDMYTMLDTNLKGSLHTVKAALPHLTNREAADPTSICLISSQAAQVSIYGYAAYAASKCGLRGFAEALQQELLPRNVRLSVVYPPDTETPGFIEENKTKPELTSKIAESSGGQQPLDVARTTLKGLKAGHFTISCGFEGIMLSTATAGMTPQSSLAHALLEVCCMGLLRVVALATLSGWAKLIMEWHRNKKRKVS